MILFLEKYIEEILFVKKTQSEILNFSLLTDKCKNCDHVIARHEYTFTVVDDYQVRRIASSFTLMQYFFQPNLY